jgi:hypothetical protein
MERCTVRLIRVLGLAAIAAMAAMAFAGAGTASADVLCLVKPSASDECPAGQGHGAGTTIVALSSNAQLLASGVETVCHSEVEGEITKNLGSHKGLEGRIDILTFSNCTGDCEFVTEDLGENLPYKVLGLGLDDVLHITSGGSGNPSALLNNCSFFGTDCLYETPSALVTVLGGSPAVIDAAVTLTREDNHSDFGCPATAGWHAKYTVSSPSSAWLASLP